MSKNKIMDTVGSCQTENPVRTSVVCPFFNEEDIIVHAAESMIDHLRKHHDSWELILVNDGSEDRSLDMLRAALERLDEKRVRVVSSIVNLGRGRALKMGIDHSSGDIIVTTEVDLSWGKDIVERLVKQLDDHPDCDFVIASPHLFGGGFLQVPWHRRMLSILGNRLLSLFFGFQVTMHTGMTRAYRRSVIQNLDVVENGKAFHLEVLLKLITLGFRYREIPATISWEHRKRAKSGTSPNSSSRQQISIIFSHMVYLAIAQPMRYFGFLAGVSFMISCGFLTAGVWQFLTGKVSIFMALMGLLMLLFCLLFIGFCVLFIHIRELSAMRWREGYPAQDLPSAERGSIIYPSSLSNG